MKSALNCGSPEVGLEEDTAILRNQRRSCQAARFPGHSSCFRTSGLENQTQFFSLEKAGEAGSTLGLAHPGLSSPASVLAPEYWLQSGSRASTSADGAWFLPPLSHLGAVPPGWGHLDAWAVLWLRLVLGCGEEPVGVTHGHIQQSSSEPPGRGCRVRGRGLVGLQHVWPHGAEGDNRKEVC